MRSTALLLFLTLLICLGVPDGDALAQNAAKLRGVQACNKSLALMAENKAAEALAVLLAAKGTMEAGDEWLWWGDVGHCYRDLRQDAKALEHYGKALKLKPDCWFRFSHCRLLHEFGRWDEALKELAKPIDPDYQDRADQLKSVIDGPFLERWPLTSRKLEQLSKKGNYLVVSDAGVTPAEMDALEKRAGKLDLNKKADRKKLEKMLKPSNHLISLANLTELARDEYLKFLGMKEKDLPQGKACKVFFMMKEEDYHAFSEVCGFGESENALGFYDPNNKYLQLYSQEGAKSRVCGLALDTVDTFFHEGWHQLFDMLTEQTPRWVDEGLAEFLGHASVKAKGKKIRLGLLIRSRGNRYTRYERIKETILEGKHIPFKEFFRFGPREWNAGDLNVHYAQAWSIAYFALQGGDKKFRKDYSKMFWELVKGRRADEIVDEIFSDKKLAVYEKSWLRYWKKT